MLNKYTKRYQKKMLIAKIYKNTKWYEIPKLYRSTTKYEIPKNIKISMDIKKKNIKDITYQNI